VKILIAGDWHSELHEEAVYQAFKQLGHEPLRFAWHRYFKSSGALLGRMTSPLARAQNKYMFGPAVAKLNRDLLAVATDEQPDLVFVYRGTHVFPQTLSELRRVAPYAMLIGYNNDDPFSHRYPGWKWRHFLAGVPEYDLVLAYRKHNLDEFKAAGARHVELLRSWFIPERNYPVELTSEDRERFECDVVFVGHYETDGRLQYLEEIARRGWRLRIFGPGYEWDDVVRASTVLKHQAPVRLVWGQNYNKALCGAKVALCFFSRLNRDTYTRRCFEIPASGTVLLSEYSDDLAGLFEPDHEAMFFKNPRDMCNKLEYLLSEGSRRKLVADAGRSRAWEGGHDVVSRMRAVLGWVNDLSRSKS
jgi:spore maturation protein CgeB